MLKVISGTAKGHNLKTLKGTATRPTSGKVKGSLFNILAEYIPQADILDLFAGTGNLGLEALSRGANLAVFVDKNRECCNIISENLISTKLNDRAQIMIEDVNIAIKKLAGEKTRFDIIFMDPPYNKNLIEETLNCIAISGIIKDNGFIVAERDIDDEVPEELSSLKLVRNQKYGDTILSFYKPM